MENLNIRTCTYYGCTYIHVYTVTVLKQLEHQGLYFSTSILRGAYLFILYSREVFIQGGALFFHSTNFCIPTN